MMTRRFTRLATLAVAMTLIPVATSSAASLWTPLVSGTTDEITAISAPSATDIVYATGGAHIYYLNGSTFTEATFSGTAPVLPFTDIAMSSNGTYGVVVGTGGEIYYTTDAGHTWSKPTTTVKEYESGSCTDLPNGDYTTLSDHLYSVKYVPGTTDTFYVTGENADVLRTTNGGQSFAEVNKTTSACVASTGQEFTDTAWISSDVGYLMSDDFGEFYVTTDGFGSATELNSGSINGYQNVNRLAVDTGNLEDAWVAGGYGDSEGIQYTTNGGNTFQSANFENADQDDQLNDIANVGTNVVSVGDNGEIWTSPDGVNFYEQEAPSPDTSNDWQAVAMVPGTSEAIVGGNNGELLSTTKANQLPDTTPPTGTISGPTKLTPGQYGTYTINATDNPGGSGVNTASYVWSIPGQANQTGPTAKFAFSKAGTYTVTVSFSDLAGNAASAQITIKVSAPAPSGSNPKTTTTGGATVGIYRKVKVSGAKSRYIPVKLADKHKRKFVIDLLTKGKHAKTLAKMTITLTGKATVHLKIGKSVKSGTYVLEVRIYTTGKHGKEVGKRIKQVFILD